MLNVSLLDTALAEISVENLVVPVDKDGAVLSAQAPEALKELAAKTRAGKKPAVFAASPEGFAARRVVFVLFDAETYPINALQRWAGAAVRLLAGEGCVALAWPTEYPRQVEALVSGALLADYNARIYKSKGEDDEPESATHVYVCVSPDAQEGAEALEEAAAQAKVVAAHVCKARDLVNAAPNLLYPESFAQQVLDATTDELKVEVFDFEALKEMGCGGIVGVGQGSTRKPRMVKLSYTGDASAPLIGLVGKGITFDSGGISLKPGAGMEEMKMDMGGAAAVFQTVTALAELKAPVNVVAFLALAENMPSGAAQRPADVVTIRNGKTVEVINTDAEGRMVMADALSLAVEENPAVVIDVATLTGACIISLGKEIAGAMGNEAVVCELELSGIDAGEELWHLPLPAAMRKSIESKFADLANVGPREGGALTAGLFLQEFVGDTPWAHIDIAGPAYNDTAAKDHLSFGGTGFGVATLVNFALGFTGWDAD
ncbi:leucyl aminopeptidase [Buchananella felis]|uniref:leucyl aminopeptidase n=1 Tax=Buchananella felis TaxID=3231492 RepID=UPI0035283404